MGRYAASRAGLASAQAGAIPPSSYLGVAPREEGLFEGIVAEFGAQFPGANCVGCVNFSVERTQMA